MIRSAGDHALLQDVHESGRVPHPSCTVCSDLPAAGYRRVGQQAAAIRRALFARVPGGCSLPYEDTGMSTYHIQGPRHVTHYLVGCRLLTQEVPDSLRGLEHPYLFQYNRSPDHILPSEI